MRDNTTHAIGHDEGGRLAGVQRLELLSWRFSENEVLSLSLLQLVHRQQPNALDVPLEESRLRFARWLVDHGHLSEELAPATDETLPAKEEKYPAPDQVDPPVRILRIAAGDRAGEPGTKTARQEEANATGDVDGTEDTERGRRALRGALSWLRRGRTKFGSMWRELMRPDYSPYGLGGWGTWGPYGAYDPYGPRGPWGDPRWISDSSWYWMRHRQGD